jgi:hypothetical protein
MRIKLTQFPYTKAVLGVPEVKINKEFSKFIPITSDVNPESNLQERVENGDF